MIRKICIFLLLFTVKLTAQNTQTSWVATLPFEQVVFKKSAPKVISVSKNPQNDFEWVVATANAGLWKTQNNGTTYEPLFSSEIPPQILTMAIDWKEKNFWVATANGMFLLENNGEKKREIPLEVSNITQIAILSSSEVLISTKGNQQNSQGVFKTTNKGKDWQQVFNQSVNKIVFGLNTAIYASVTSFQGKETIYKSTDKGGNWVEISNDKFPKNTEKTVLTVANSGKIYALIDDANPMAKVSEFSKAIEELSFSEIEKFSDSVLEKYLFVYGLQERYTIATFRQLLKINAKNEKSLPLKSLLGAEKESNGAKLFESTDFGSTWQEIGFIPADVLGGKNSRLVEITVNPFNDNELFLSGFRLLHSIDGGRSWKTIKENKVSSQVFDLQLSDKQLFFITSEGFFVSFDKGQSWVSQYFKQGASVYSLVFDSESKTLFASFENNGVWKQEGGIWEKIASESGKIIFGQQGKIFLSTNNGKIITSEGKLWQEIPITFSGEIPRFSSEIPLLVSPQNKNILYAGGNMLWQSFNAGEQWNSISKDVTNGNKDLNTAFPTVSAIAESPFQFGLLYTGSQDGMIYGSTNAGVSWQLLYSAFPQKNKVVAIVASRHQKNRVYVLLKSEFGSPLLFKSDDNGQRWADLKANLPNENVSVLVEDDTNHQVLYLGTQNGLYVSFDQGEKWHRFEKLPQVEVSQITMDTQKKILYIGTQGRGIYKLNISALKELKAAIQDQLFYPISKKYELKYSPYWGKSITSWDTPIEPILYFDGFASKANQVVKITIKQGEVVLNSFEYKLSEGFNFIPFDVTASEKGRLAHENSLDKILYQSGKNYLPKGKYVVHFQGEMVDEERELEIY